MTQAQRANLPTSVSDISSPLSNPERVQASVDVSPIPEWVIKREFDETYRAPGGGAHSILLLDRQRRFSEHAHFERQVRRLETLQAVQDAAQWRLDFDPATQRVELHTLVVRRAGQISEHVRPDRIRVLQREHNLERFILDGGVSLVVLLDDVRLGDIIDASYTIRSEPRLFAERCWLFAEVPWTVPLRAFHLRVLFPVSVTMQWKSDLSGAAPAERELSGEREWSWKLENTLAAEPEPDVPSWYLPGRWFQVSDFSRWEDIAAGFHAAWLEDFSAPELKKEAEQIASEAATTMERAERVIVLVQDEVRYLSSAEDPGNQLPSSPGIVLQRRFGNSMDKASLLVHLLRRFGIPARPVLVHSQWRHTLANFLPMPDAFNHAIVEYEIEGERRWCDATARLQGGGPLGRAASEFGLGLPIAEGVSGLEPITPPKNVRHTLDLQENFYLDTAGRSSTMTMVITANGIEADQLRSSFALEGGESVARNRERLYQGIFHDLKRAGELEWRDDRQRNEFLLAATYETQHPFAGEGPGGVLLFQYHAHLVQSVLEFPARTRRRQPLALRYPCDFRHTVEVHSPALTGRSESRQRPPARDFYCSVDLRSQPGRLTRDYNVRTNSNSVAAVDFGEHIRAVRDLLPSTFIKVALPTGVAFPRRRGREDTLLPAAVAGPGHQDAGSSVGKATDEVALEAMLPSVPATTLQSGPAEAPQTLEKKAAALREVVAPERAARRRLESVAEPFQPKRPDAPVAAVPGSRRRRRPKRNKRSESPDRTWLFLMLVVGLVVVAVLVTLSMNKK